MKRMACVQCGQPVEVDRAAAERVWCRDCMNYGNADENFGLKVGDRIMLLSMGLDDPCAMEPGAIGTVTGFFVGVGLSQIQVDWDPEVQRSLCLAPEVDTWIKLSGEQEVLV